MVTAMVTSAPFVAMESAMKFCDIAVMLRLSQSLSRTLSHHRQTQSLSQRQIMMKSQKVMTQSVGA